MNLETCGGDHRLLVSARSRRGKGSRRVTVTEFVGEWSDDPTQLRLSHDEAIELANALVDAVEHGTRTTPPTNENEALADALHAAVRPADESITLTPIAITLTLPDGSSTVVPLAKNRGGAYYAVEELESQHVSIFVDVVAAPRHRRRD